MTDKQEDKEASTQGQALAKSDILSIKIHSDTIMFKGHVHKCTQEKHM